MLRSISDIIAYQRTHKVHREKWPLMLWLWREASAVYSDAVVASKMQQGTASSNPEDHRVSFDTIMRACDDIKCKRTAANCTLQYVDGQVSVNMFLQFFFQVQYRLASEQLLKASGIAKVRLQAFMDIVQKQYDVSVAVLSLLCQNVDFAHLTVLGELHSGPQGEALFKVRDLLAQAPMKVDLCIHTDKNLGCLPLVPFMLSFQPQSNGDVCIEVGPSTVTLSIAMFSLVACMHACLCSYITSTKNWLIRVRRAETTRWPSTATTTTRC